MPTLYGKSYLFKQRDYKVALSRQSRNGRIYSFFAGNIRKLFAVPMNNDKDTLSRRIVRFTVVDLAFVVSRGRGIGGGGEKTGG